MVGMDQATILDLDYADRQLIVVTPDLMAQAVRDETTPPKGVLGAAKVHWKSAQQSVSERDWIGAGTAILQLYAAITKTPDWAATAVVEAVRAWARARASGIQILPVGKTAAKKIIFPPGHPRNGVLYIGHPALPGVYYPMADFHRVTFEHKFCEVIELLMNLGATKIRVEHVSGWSKDFSARLSVPLGQASETVALEAGQDSGSRTNLLYEASLAGTDKPTIPESLVWYAHEPTWQAVARGRINFGLSDFSLSVTYEDDFGVTAGLKAAVVKAGLELGGKFEDHQSTVWRLGGTFYAPLKAALRSEKAR